MTETFQDEFFFKDDLLVTLLGMGLIEDFRVKLKTGEYGNQFDVIWGKVKPIAQKHGYSILYVPSTKEFSYKRTTDSKIVCLDDLPQPFINEINEICNQYKKELE
jgi:hypothetical protein